MICAGLHDFVYVSISESLESLWLIMCIDAPESTTNSRSSGLRVDEGKHLFSEGEKNVALFFSFNFNTFLDSFHAASRAPCSCHSVSSWDRSSNFGALGLRSWGSPGQIFPSEGFWSRILVWRAMAFLNFTRWIGFRMSVFFRRIDFSGVTSWNTQPSCRASGPLSSTWPLQFCHHSFWTFYKAVRQTDDVRMSTFPQTDNHSWSCRTSILEGTTFHKMSCCKFLWGNPCKAIKTFYHWGFYLWDFGSSMIFAHSAAWKNPRILCTRCFVPWLLTSAFFSWFPFLAPKFLFRISFSILLFTIVFNL